MGTIRQLIEREVAAMPSHADFVARTCGAAPPQDR
jgi:hypothetical protein